MKGIPAAKPCQPRAGSRGAEQELKRFRHGQDRQCCPQVGSFHNRDSRALPPVRTVRSAGPGFPGRALSVRSSGRAETSVRGQRGGIAAFSSEQGHPEVLYTITWSKVIRRLGQGCGVRLVAALMPSPLKSSPSTALPSARWSRTRRSELLPNGLGFTSAQELFLYLLL